MVPLPEQISITVRSSVGEDGPLTVQDGLRQVLDFFDLLSLAQGEEGRGAVSWHLVSITKASPLTAIGEAILVTPGVLAEGVARLARDRVAYGLEALVSTGEVPDWMNKEASEKTRALLHRNLNGIGRTDIRFGEDGPASVIVERNARSSLLALDRADLERSSREPDLSRVELGSIEGKITDTTTYHGKPAIRVRERSNDTDVVCVMMPDLAERIGRLHDWQEVWTGNRVLVVGELTYNRSGLVSRVYANDFVQVNDRQVEYSEVANPNFTGGLSPMAYLDKLWDEDDG